jgi:hypothetical protein
MHELLLVSPFNHYTPSLMLHPDSSYGWQHALRYGSTACSTQEQHMASSAAGWPHPPVLCSWRWSYPGGRPAAGCGGCSVSIPKGRMDWRHPEASGAVFWGGGAPISKPGGGLREAASSVQQGRMI